MNSKPLRSEAAANQALQAATRNVTATWLKPSTCNRKPAPQSLLRRLFNRW